MFDKLYFLRELFIPKESIFIGIKDECCTDKNVEYTYMFEGNGIYTCKKCKRVFRMLTTKGRDGN